MSETFLYLTTTGHKTGQPHRIEIWYVTHDGRFYMVSEKFATAHWVQNILAQPRVHFSIGTREDNESIVATTPAVGEVLDVPADAELVHAVQQKMDTKYGWSNGLVVQLTTTDG